MSNVTFHLGNQTIIIHDNDGDNHFDSRRDTIERRTTSGSSGHQITRTDTYRSYQANHQMTRLFGSFPYRRLDYTQLRLMATHLDTANTRSNAPLTPNANWLTDVGNETDTVRAFMARSGLGSISSQFARYVTSVRSCAVNRELDHVRYSSSFLQGQALFDVVNALDRRVSAAHLSVAVGYSEALNAFRRGALERETSRLLTDLSSGGLRGQGAFDAIGLVNRQTTSWGYESFTISSLADLNRLLNLIYTAGQYANSGDSRFTSVSGEMNSLIEQHHLPTTRLEELSRTYTRNHR